MVTFGGHINGCCSKKSLYSEVKVSPHHVTLSLDDRGCCSESCASKQAESVALHSLARLTSSTGSPAASVFLLVLATLIMLVSASLFIALSVDGLPALASASTLPPLLFGALLLTCALGRSAASLRLHTAGDERLLPQLQPQAGALPSSQLDPAWAAAVTTISFPQPWAPLFLFSLFSPSLPSTRSGGLAAFQAFLSVCVCAVDTCFTVTSPWRALNLPLAGTNLPMGGPTCP